MFDLKKKFGTLFVEVIYFEHGTVLLRLVFIYIQASLFGSLKSVFQNLHVFWQRFSQGLNITPPRNHINRIGKEKYFQNQICKVYLIKIRH